MHTWAVHNQSIKPFYSLQIVQRTLSWSVFSGWQRNISSLIFTLNEYSSHCSPELSQNNLPGMSIFKFRMYFTNLQTIINYSQEELHLHYNFMVVSDNSINVDVETEDTAFSFLSFSNLYRCKVVMGQKENQAFLFKNTI